MLKTAHAFEERMDSILMFLDILSASVAMAKSNDRYVKSKAAFVVSSKRLKSIIIRNSNFTLVGYDGSYLTACAEFEMTVRRLIEKFVGEANVKCSEYHHLPKVIRDWYPDGCSSIILNISQDKYRHLTKDQIVKSLASCQRVKGYTLVGEAFSDTRRNFRPKVIEEVLSIRLGLPKVWQKLSREKALQTAVGTSDLATAERALKDKLEKIIQRRNDIIHRGRSYFAPSDSEVRDCSNFLKALVSGLSSVMVNHLASF
jgi:hypothetical protein